MKIYVCAKFLLGEVSVVFSKYPSSGGTAIALHRGGVREVVASVNLKAYGYPIPPQDEVWLKGWSENEGVLEALEKAGVVELTGLTIPAGYATAQHARIIGEAKKEVLMTQ